MNTHLDQNFLSSIQSRLEGKNDDHRVKPGETKVLRLLPTTDGWPIREISLHWNIEGNRKILPCSRNSERLGKCDFCDFLSSLPVNLQKLYGATERFYANFLDRASPETANQPKIFSFPKMACMQIAKLLSNGNILDTVNGYDLSVTLSEDKKYQINRLSSPSPLADSETKIQNILDQVIDLKKLYPLPGKEDITAAIEAIKNNQNIAA